MSVFLVNFSFHVQVADRFWNPYALPSSIQICTVHRGSTVRSVSWVTYGCSHCVSTWVFVTITVKSKGEGNCLAKQSAGGYTNYSSTENWILQQAEEMRENLSSMSDWSVKALNWLWNLSCLHKVFASIFECWHIYFSNTDLFILQSSIFLLKSSTLWYVYKSCSQTASTLCYQLLCSTPLCWRSSITAHGHLYYIRFNSFCVIAPCLLLSPKAA